ncbi:hypothetical protein BVI434_1950020 [Burkholderia vietnamiensis]|nr:hypothetical protein BVI434_1950020 [Burkholderia vietnamiensis]
MIYVNSLMKMHRDAFTSEINIVSWSEVNA